MIVDASMVIDAVADPGPRGITALDILAAQPPPSLSWRPTLTSGSLRYAGAIYVAAAERHATALLTADTRIERSRAPISCKIITDRATTSAGTEQTAWCPCTEC